MDWNRRIDGYCERVSPDFWAEPLNALTNGAFILAGVAVLIMALRQRRLDGPVTWLTLLLFVIGTGSFLFHTYATVWAAITDTGPIGLFILSYFAIAMNRFAGLAWWQAALASLGFLLAMGLVSWGLRLTIAPLIGGSTSYVPALLALLAVGLWLRGRQHPAGGILIAVAGIFAVSLTFRALDVALCDDWALGTHFMWHILNAGVLGLLIAVVIRHGASDDGRRLNTSID